MSGLQVQGTRHRKPAFSSSSSTSHGPAKLQQQQHHQHQQRHGQAHLSGFEPFSAAASASSRKPPSHTYGGGSSNGDVKRIQRDGGGRRRDGHAGSAQARTMVCAFTQQPDDFLPCLPAHCPTAVPTPRPTTAEGSMTMVMIMYPLA